jgi:hypothetical protein
MRYKTFLLVDAWGFGIRNYLQHLPLAALLAALVGVIDYGFTLLFKDTLQAATYQWLINKAPFIHTLPYMTVAIGILVHLAWLALPCALFIHLALHLYENRTFIAEESVTEGIAVIRSYISILLIAILTVIGVLLLIVPGFYILSSFFFTPWLIQDKKMGMVRALEYSSLLTDGIKRRICAFLVSILGIGLGIECLYSWVLTYFRVPYTTLPAVVLHILLVMLYLISVCAATHAYKKVKLRLNKTT